jgi:hypothetical protein
MTVEAEAEITTLTTLKAQNAAEESSATVLTESESVAQMVLKGTQALALCQFETAAEVF